ncbi:MAG: acyltransferase family protein, partial [Acidimicrobiales bacterium]
MEARALNASGSPGAPRDVWLDAVRSIALLRVIVWHAFGAAAITYVVSAVPAMFFVTGSLLAKSLSHRSAASVLVDRARRLLVPLAAFSVVAIAAMATAWAVNPSSTTAPPWRGLVLWFVPVADPGGSAWEGGYLSSPLWYLRALLWLVCLSPLLLRAFRWRPAVALAVPTLLVVALDVVGRRPGWAVPWLADLVWQAGDVALYGVFLILGFAHRDGRLARLGTGAWMAVAGMSAIGAAAWVLTQPVPGLVVNNSHPAHLLAGLAWLGVIMAGRGWLERLARAPVAGAAVAWITQRTMTIYLWHTAALFLTRLALGRTGELPVGVWSLGLLAGTAAVMTVLILAFGWVEDLAGRRPVRLWPAAGPGRIRAGRRLSSRPAHARVVGIPAAAGVAVVAAASSLLGGATAGVAGARPPVPSQAPPRPSFRTAAVGDAPAEAPVAGPALFARVGGGVVWSPRTLAPPPPRDLAADLQAEIEEWGRTEAVPGAQVGLLVPRVVSWEGAFGVDPFA